MAGNVPIADSQLGRLCPICRNIFDTWDEIVEELEFYFLVGRRRGTYGISYHKDAIAWRAEVERGCVFCMRLFDSLKNEASSKIMQSLRDGANVHVYLNTTFLNSAERANREYTLWVSVTWVGDDRTGPKLDGTIRLVPKPLDIVPKLAPSTSSYPSLAFVKEWIKSCRNNHPRCRSTTGFRLPTRLIGFFSDGVRLWVPGDTPSELSNEYVTLSHCWGKFEALKLTKSNIGGFRQKVPVEDICKTFQDAIIVAVTLGYRFLWIDSLCIIQDDEDDWRRESALMSEVYGNAAVNLAATHAKDGSVGLFRERDVSRAARQYVQTKSLQSYELPDDQLYYRCLDRSPLSSRAWVFQERYLAQRTIHFSAEQIFCECRYHIVCETWPEGAPIDVSGPEDIPFSHIRKSLGPEEWQEAVSLYSRAQLTYSKDRLVALSGVARKFQSATGDEYVAGLWKTGLEQYLCWAVERPSETHQTSTEIESESYQAPSWSWASTDQPISWILYMIPVANRFGNHNLVVLISILDVNLVPVGPDPLGQLQDAKLKIKCGPLIRASVVSALLNDFDKPFDNSCQIRLGSDRIYLLRGEGQVRADVEIEYTSIVETLYFVPILIDPSGESCLHYRRGITICGLVVMKAGDGRPGLFKRFGAWEIIFNVGSYKELMQLFLVQEGSLMDEAFYEEILNDNEDDIPQYIITLI